ncbi:hypothetical protein QNI16_27725 [Cytophagaceae bacterium YF14B1]|uniref:Uncharacterized protein n=1 Tax=Xanthocytophaga flava TaxID=3048013 RepID=A0AAE3QVS7_9BACT|nr:hypothetical protein [Xanthocytophaga flavus]MDJ1484318.1 hypothetical protein [Xanthocytophaga flavus]
MPYHAYYINEKDPLPKNDAESLPMTEQMLEQLYLNPPPPPKRYWNEAPAIVVSMVDQVLEAYYNFDRLARTQLFPTELLHYRVLQVATQQREMHEATMFDLLFTDVWEDA